jgi:hypothetical protein
VRAAPPPDAAPLAELADIFTHTPSLENVPPSFPAFPAAGKGEWIAEQR